jgi:hypothetical protein
VAAKTTAKQKNSRGNNLQLGYYVVSIIDLLGQKQKLSGWSKITREKDATTMAAIRDTVGNIVWFTKRFAEFFETFNAKQLSADKLAQLSGGVSDVADTAFSFRQHIRIPSLPFKL